MSLRTAPVGCLAIASALCCSCSGDVCSQPGTICEPGPEDADLEIDVMRPFLIATGDSLQVDVSNSCTTPEVFLDNRVLPPVDVSYGTGRLGRLQVETPPAAPGPVLLVVKCVVPPVGLRYRKSSASTTLRYVNPPPSIVESLPARDATGVARTSAIMVRFDYAIVPTTINAATFLVKGVAGVPKYDEALKTARYEYEGSLPPGVITVTLRGGDEGIRSVDGLPYKVVDSWTFTTGE